MKRKLLTLVTVLLFSGVMFAQDGYNSIHWPDFDYHQYVRPMTVIGQVYFDDVVQNRDDIEVASFVGDELRGRWNLIRPYPNDPDPEWANKYFVYLPCYYVNPGETFTFKAYDIAAGIEYDICPMQLVGRDNGYGDPDNPYDFHFSRTEEPTYGPEYPWNPSHAYPGIGMIVNAQIKIDGVLVDRDSYEVGAFCGEECRANSGDVLDDWTDDNLGYFAFMNIVGNDGDIINFYLYDHENDQIVPGVCYTTIELENGGELGINITGGDIFVLNFMTDNIQTFTKNIAAYTEGEKDHYYLIASPIGEVSPEDVTNMLSNSYDLYYFDQASDLEWITYKPGVGATDPGFNLVSGKGYLYANSGTATQPVTTLTFTGYPTYGEAEVTLTKNTDASVEFPGWNLVGNPLAEPAYIGTRAYYRMNGDAENGGDEIVPATAGTAIDVMEGIFVVADTDEETLTFNTEQPGKCAALVMNITRDRGYAIDRAIVRFDNGQMLPKFQLNANSTKLYIPQDTKDYAVVSAGNEGEMPVNFKAEKNGTYTIGVSTQDVDFRYLHLIDNKVGNDIDLLETPSYSFDALTTDYASRFKLVFVCGDASDDSFTFFNGSSWFINNEGKATLQVIDVTGRILKSESISGCAYVNIDEAPGVYMVRLIKGENVKVQKIVVK